MNWGKLTRENSRELMKSLSENHLSMNEEQKILRKDLLDIRTHVDGIVESYNLKTQYAVDLHFGLAMYKLLNEKYDFSERLANDDEIWAFLSIMVIPDVVLKRWENGDENRFWKRPRRIWLKTLWWYIYLSWQGNEEETLQILKFNSTDEIMQLVDRSGSGYRVDFTRALMMFIYQQRNKRTDKTFRKILKLNTIKCQNIEPALFAGGVEGYINYLFEYLGGDV